MIFYLGSAQLTPPRWHASWATTAKGGRISTASPWAGVQVPTCFARRPIRSVPHHTPPASVVPGLRELRRIGEDAEIPRWP